MKGIIVDGVAQTEADHFEKCPGCGRWVDRCNLDQVLEHVHGAWDEIEEEVAGKRPVH
jgi:Zn-finger nucleic acid-binding protein